MNDILIVDDERTVREGLKRLFESAGMSVRTARSGAEGLAAFRESRPGLVLLDVMMPVMGGFEVCGRIRAEDAAVPIMFLTGFVSEEGEVMGMGLGADDYISKDASEAAILARVRRALERSSSGRAEATATLSVGRATVDFALRVVRFGDGGEERLTGAELDILRALASDRSRYFSCAEIFAATHGEGQVCEAATLRSQISRLKSKLRSAGELIRAERGAGYRLLP